GVVLTRFFFQAEDGIRDGHVTGVQTCALPISFRVLTKGESGSTFSATVYNTMRRVPALVVLFLISYFPVLRAQSTNASLTGRIRSEERRVGKSEDLYVRRIMKKKKKKTIRINH